MMHRLVPALISQMGEAYPELGRAEASMTSALEQEEGRFQRTLGRGLALLDEATEGMGEGDRLSGETAFKLYDTFGFPLDLTQDVLRARGVEVDEDGFNTAMSVQKAQSQASWQGSGETGSAEVWFGLRDTLGASTFTGYEATSGDAELKGIIVEGQSRKSLKKGESAELIFDCTPFYGESGGQAGDKGEILFANGER